jgi:hypothetical protein
VLRARPKPLLFIALLVCVAYTRVLADDVVAISSKVLNGYVRPKLADGTPKPQTYAFGEGETLGGIRIDPTIDRMKFLDVAQVAAKALAKEKFYPTRSAEGTDLLILVYWGTTRAEQEGGGKNNIELLHQADRAQDAANLMLKDATNASERKAALDMEAEANGAMIAALSGRYAENVRQEALDMRNVAILGYDSWWLKSENQMAGGPLGYERDDLFYELEQDRYFVVLTALDYQLLAKHRKSKILWEAHISIREHGNQFDQRLADMMAKAQPYFGNASNGLQHLAMPEEGSVELGAVKSLGEVPAPAQPAK